MKRFIVSILCVTVFCVGLGALVEKAGARFKSDEKALSIIKQARLAIGGDQSIADVRSMIIKGNTTLTLKVDGATRNEQGETEIAMQFPDKLSKMVRIGRHDAADGERMMSEKHDVIMMRHPAGGEVGEAGGKTVVIRKVNGGNGEVESVITEGKNGELTTADGKRVIVRKVDGAEIEQVIVGPEKGKRVILDQRDAGEHIAHRQNELLRTALSLLLTAPEGMDVSYTFVGESDVDGTTCNVVNAEFAGSNVKLYLSKASSLPVMVSYLGHAMPNVMFFRTKEPASGAASVEPTKEKVTFSRKVDTPETSEVQVRFADYRSVNGVQLPYKWTTSIAGQTSEVFDVTNYDLNPANIAEKFQNERVLVRTKKEAN
ncbi:MAG TPA: hypothetical protein VMZ26_02385 [Pyrinomonadaceae bacterium]|nr:hypothetical protein [Pyrinomonadaceae bacterium]